MVMVIVIREDGIPSDVGGTQFALEQQEYQRMGNEMKEEIETCFGTLFSFFGCVSCNTIR